MTGLLIFLFTLSLVAGELWLLYEDVPTFYHSRWVRVRFFVVLAYVVSGIGILCTIVLMSR